MNPIRLTAKNSNEQICPYCRSGITEGDRWSCEECGVELHSDCSKETKGCTTLGCSGVPENGEHCPACSEAIDADDALCPHCLHYLQPAGAQVVQASELRAGPQSRHRVRQSQAHYINIAVTVGFFVSLFGMESAPALSLLGVFPAIAWALYNSYLNFRQAYALLFVRAARPSKAMAKSLVSLEGVPEIDQEPLETPCGRDAVWLRTTSEVFQRRWKHSNWKTLSADEFCLPFALGEINVANRPTEVHGAKREGGNTSLFPADGTRRRTTHYISPGTPLNAVGQLLCSRRRYTLVPDSTAGLLLTTHSPRRAAALEGAKAIGLLLAALAIAAFCFGYASFSGA